MKIFSPFSGIINFTNSSNTPKKEVFKRIHISNDFGIFSVNRYGLIGEILSSGYHKGEARIQALELWLEFIPKWDVISSNGISFIQIISREVKFKNDNLTYHAHFSTGGIDEEKMNIKEKIKGFSIDNSHLKENPLFIDKSISEITFYPENEEEQNSFQNKGTYEILTINNIEGDPFFRASSDSGNIAFKVNPQFNSINMYDLPQIGFSSPTRINGKALNPTNVEYVKNTFETYVVGLNNLQGESLELDGKFYGGISWGFKHHITDYKKYPPKLISGVSGYFKRAAHNYNQYLESLGISNVFIKQSNGENY